ncbi:MAG: hypothetical protein KKB30_12555 [Proteobacteria bacterium]|nr:hypothetical protein [Pseudomonadota bacterium]MBU1714655.1 hypothetical protein [Pseudomonadota bacterium]
MDPEKMMTGISKEVLTLIKEMEKAKTAEEKLTHSKTIKNLCTSLEVFFNFLSDMAPYDTDDYDEDDGPLPF